MGIFMINEIVNKNNFVGKSNYFLLLNTKKFDNFSKEKKPANEKNIL